MAMTITRSVRQAAVLSALLLSACGAAAAQPGAAPRILFEEKFEDTDFA